ncbi:hypothetical protein JL100_018045 [Skermanella mucosa]|uniref:hypothetical protein n=1 Tax=Skermanella mucosa TaxID=1789672 RepID=UPI00192BA5BA|nr:hypothetical protein [Skermanella mucosa]UEM18988.1 hypothetical protein JL100_018045 [Skermanella mucosa]
MPRPSTITVPPLSSSQLVEMHGDRASSRLATRDRLARQMTPEVLASLARPYSEIVTVTCLRPELLRKTKAK